MFHVPKLGIPVHWDGNSIPLSKNFVVKMLHWFLAYKLQAITNVICWNIPSKLDLPETGLKSYLGLLQWALELPHHPYVAQHPPSQSPSFGPHLELAAGGPHIHEPEKYLIQLFSFYIGLVIQLFLYIFNMSY